MDSHRLDITLDEAHAAKLSHLAARVDIKDGTLARLLLSAATDDADPDVAPCSTGSTVRGVERDWAASKPGTSDTIPLATRRAFFGSP